MKTVLVDVAELRGKETAGLRPLGLADRTAQVGEPVNVGRRSYLRLPRSKWEELVVEQTLSASGQQGTDREVAIPHAVLTTLEARYPGAAVRFNAAAHRRDADQIYLRLEDFRELQQSLATYLKRPKPGGSRVRPPLLGEPARTRVIKKCQLKPNGPGQWLHNWIKRLTGEDFQPGCGCCKFARQMDEWGWLGCLKRTSEIRDRMVQEAKRRGATVDSDTGWRAFAKAARQMLGKRGD